MYHILDSYDLKYEKKFETEEEALEYFKKNQCACSADRESTFAIVKIENMQKYKRTVVEYTDEIYTATDEQVQDILKESEANTRSYEDSLEAE